MNPCCGKPIDAQDAKLAAEYFHSVAGGSRVLASSRTDTVPVTHPGPHNVQLVDATGNQRTDREMRHHRGAGGRQSDDVARCHVRVSSPNVPNGKHQEGRDAGEGPAIPARTVSVRHVSWRGLEGKSETFFPPLAGRSPCCYRPGNCMTLRAALAMAVYAALMKPVVAHLTDQDIVDPHGPYIISLQP